MMKQKNAVIILTYTSPKQTLRLVNAMNNGDFDFYIHLDKKVDMKSHEEFDVYNNVFFIEEPIDIKWAGYSTTEAIIKSVKFIERSGNKYSYISLISGQDYPIKSAAYITQFLNDNAGKEFINYRYFDEWTEAIERVEKYHLTEYKFRGQYLIQKAINGILPKRKFPVDTKLCGKETFWTLTYECAIYTAHKIDSNKQLKRFLRYTWGCDEFIFQTIIMGSHFKKNVVNDNLRFINWPDGQAARPNFFVSSDFERILASKALFGRKFDIKLDEHILDLLDHEFSITF